MSKQQTAAAASGRGAQRNSATKGQTLKVTREIELDEESSRILLERAEAEGKTPDEVLCDLIRADLAAAGGDTPAKA